MTTHTITLARHTAQVFGLMGALVLGTWDSYGTEQLLLRPGPEWDSLAIDATFHNTPSDEGVTMLADTDGLVPVPPEACKQPSKYATITFRGVQDGVQRISCNLPYMVLDHAQVPGANSTATPSEIAQALAQMQGLRDGAVDAKNQAEAARDDAAKSATAAAASATAAAGDAKTASDAAAGAADAKAAAVAAQKDAAASKAAADSTANSINNSMMQIAANKEAVSQLKEDLVNLSEKKCYHPTLIDNEYISNEDGSAVPYDGWSRTDYIECYSDTEIIDTFKSGLIISLYSGFYDADKNFICSMANCTKYDSDGKIISIFSPHNAAYYRISGENKALKKLLIETSVSIHVGKSLEIAEKSQRESENTRFIFCNHLDLDNINAKTYLLETGNITFNQDGYFTSDYIQVKECYDGKNYRYILAFDIENNSWGAHARQIAFYGSNKEFINLWNKTKDSQSIVEIPSDAKYVRVVFYEGKSQYYIGFQNNTNTPLYVNYTKALLGFNIPNFPSVICNSDRAISSMLMTATDYWENSEIRYGNNHTPFDDVCGGKYVSNDNTYTGTAYQLDCSSFVTLCLRGIRFDCSRFLSTNSENINSPNGFIWDDSVTYDNLLDTGLEAGRYGRIYANNLAKYAYEHGYLYTVAKDFSNVKAGDLLFNSNCETWYGLKFWGKIGHVMLVCQTIPRSDGKISVKVFQSIHGENYGVFRTHIIPSDDMNILYGARYPIQDCSFPISVIYENHNITNVDYNFETGSSYKTIHEIILNEDLKTGVYTLVFKAEESDNNLIWEYWVGDGSNAEYNIGSSGTYVKKRPDGFHEVHIEIPMSLTIDNPKRLRIFVKALATTSGTITFNGVKLYKGYVTSSPFELD